MDVSAYFKLNSVHSIALAGGVVLVQGTRAYRHCFWSEAQAPPPPAELVCYGACIGACGVFARALLPALRREEAAAVRGNLPGLLSASLALLGLGWSAHRYRRAAGQEMPVSLQLPTLLACSFLAPLGLPPLEGGLLTWAWGAGLNFLALASYPIARGWFGASAAANRRAQDAQLTLEYRAPDFSERAAALACRHVPAWACSPASAIACTLVSGGITNSLCRLTRRVEGDSVLVRVFGMGSELLIDRARDNDLFERMAARGHGPAHYATFANGRVEGWIEHSRPLEPPEMGAGPGSGAGGGGSPLDIAGHLARALAFQHSLEDVEPAPRPWTPLLWARLRAWVALVGERPACLAGVPSAPSLEFLCAGLGWLEEVLPSPENSFGAQFLGALAEEEAAALLAKGARAAAGVGARREAAALCFRVVLCHNDVLSGNVLLVRPPGQPPRLQLIDYEYMGPNFLAYDVANCFNEHCGFLPFEPEVNYPSVHQQRHFLEAYLGAMGIALPDSDCREVFFEELRRWISLFALASNFWCALLNASSFANPPSPHNTTPTKHSPRKPPTFLGGLWALIQSQSSAADFNYKEYAEARLSAFNRLKEVYPKRSLQKRFS